MKKKIILAIALAILTGCSKTQTSKKSASETLKPTEVSTDSYSAYTKQVTNRKQPSSYYAAVNSQYTMSYSDDTSQLFILDGTLEYDGSSAHTTQHITSHDTQSVLEGYYYDGRLYNTYNGVTYYEDMSFNDLKSSMLVPMDIYQFPQESISSFSNTTNDDGNVEYQIELNNDSAASIFTSRYDVYGLANYDNYKITSNKITDVFDKVGNFIGEKAIFEASVTYQNQTVSVKYEGSVSYINLDQTAVSITDEQKREQASYVYFQDIDVDSISDGEILDDSAADTVTDTFKKRLVNRLNYTDNGDGTYTTDFNTTESYSIDFNNHTFTYKNYSIAYSYSWSGDVSSMSSCTYVFADGATSDSCDSTTLDTMKNVKTYLEMELYYCGLSLDDLQSEQ